MIWQAAPGAFSLTVIVKATFTIVPGGEATLAPVQEPVAALGTGAMVEDLAPLKPRVDVLALGANGDDDATVIDVAGARLGARGPIPPLAPARRLLLGDAAFRWASAVLSGSAGPAGPPPEGFDFSFFQASPRAQQIDLLRLAAPLAFLHLLPGRERAETRLPPRRPQAFRVDPKSGRVTEIALRCDTLCVDAGRATLTLSFRGLADLKSGDELNAGKIVVAALESGKRIRAERVDRYLRRGEPIDDEQPEGRSVLEVRHDAVIVPATAGDTMALPDMMAVPEVPPVPKTAKPSKRERLGTFPLPTNANESSLLRGFGVVLPFRDAAPPAGIRPPSEAPSGVFPPPALTATRPPPLEETTTDLPRDASAPEHEIENEETTVELSGAEAKVLFGPEVGSKAAPPAQHVEPPAPVAAPRPAPLLVPAKPAMKIPAPLGPRLGRASPSAPPPALPALSNATPPKPAMLATPKPMEGLLAKPAPVSVPVSAPAPVPAPESLSETFDPASAMKVERCAALAAELRHRPSERAALLEAARLSEAQWTAVEKHWAEAITRETDRGARKLLGLYDAAYVATQERLGLRVGLAEHARLQVATERGTTAAVLGELGLESADQIRLGRVWTQRLVEDPSRMAELATSIDAARGA